MIADTFPKMEAYIKAVIIERRGSGDRLLLRPFLHPTSMMMTLNTFSMLVVGATFPKPTDVREEKVK